MINQPLVWHEIWITPLYRLSPVLKAILFGAVIGAICLVSPAAGLGLAFSINITLVAITHPIFLCYLVLTGIALTSGMERGRILPGLIPNEAILFFSILLAVPVILARRCKVTRPHTALMVGSLVLLFGTMVLPVLAYYFRGISLSFIENIKLIAPAQYILLSGLFLYIPEDDNQRLGLVRWMWICCGVVAVVGLAQAANIQPVISLLQKWYPSNHTSVSGEIQRVTSLMGVWNGLGTFLMVNLLLIRSTWHMLKKQSDINIAIVVSILCIICLMASGSYAGIIGLIIGFVLIGYFDRRGVRDIKIMVFGFLAGLVPLRSAIAYRYNFQYRDAGSLLPQTFVFRMYVWKDIFWPVIKKNWLWGYRPQLTDLAWQYPESIYFSYMLGSGIFALLAHFIWLFITLRWLFKQMKSPKDVTRSLAIFVFTLLVVLSIMGITNEVFTFSGTVDYLWILLGLIAGKEQLVYVKK